MASTALAGTGFTSLRPADQAETQLREVIEQAPDKALRLLMLGRVRCNARAGTARRRAPLRTGGDDEPGLRPGMNPDQRTLSPAAGRMQIP